MSYDYDVVIVGGGLVGGCLALALAPSGLRVAVAEFQTEAARRAAPAGDRALALSRGTAQLLERLGVWSLLRDQLTPIRHIHVSDRGYFGKTRLHAADKGVEALGYVAIARVLEDAVDAALQRAGTNRIRPARLIGLQAGGDGIHAALKAEGDCVNVTARLAVAADGGDSTVRKLLGIAADVREYGQTAIVTTARVARDTAATAYERFSRDGPVAFLPLAPHQCSVIWTLRDEAAEELLNQSTPEFLESLQSAFGTWLGRIEAIGARVAFPLKLIRAAAMVHDRVVLIGNAMHQIHPVAGQGFNLGIRDAIVLAERLLAQASLGGDIGDPAMLHAYARARRRDLDRVIGFTDGLVRIFSNDWLPLVWARNLGLVVLERLPPAKQLLARHAMGYGERL